MNKYVMSAIGVLLFWLLVSVCVGSALWPWPHQVAIDLLSLLISGDSWRHFLLTFFRGSIGLLIALVGALLFGIPCGFIPKAMATLSPVVSIVQSCPTIVWISLLLVWAGTGSMVPASAVFVATFPILFINIAQGISVLDVRLISMTKVYRVSVVRLLFEVVFPGIRAFSTAAVSYALGITWKVTATAEFIGSSDGVGAQLHWAYLHLNMPRIFSWAIVLIVLGQVIDVFVASPMRKQVWEN